MVLNIEYMNRIDIEQIFIIFLVGSKHALSFVTDRFRDVSAYRWGMTGDNVSYEPFTITKKVHKIRIKMF